MPPSRATRPVACCSPLRALLKSKKLTNIRAAGRDDAVSLTPPLILTLEKALAFIGDDELVEVTPLSIRLRKRHLDTHERKRAERRAAG